MDKDKKWICKAKIPKLVMVMGYVWFLYLVKCCNSYICPFKKFATGREKMCVRSLSQQHLWKTDLMADFVPMIKCILFFLSPSLSHNFNSFACCTCVVTCKWWSVEWLKHGKCKLRWVLFLIIFFPWGIKVYSFPLGIGWKQLKTSCCWTTALQLDLCPCLAILLPIPRESWLALNFFGPLLSTPGVISLCTYEVSHCKPNLTSGRGT